MTQFHIDPQGHGSQPDPWFMTCSGLQWWCWVSHTHVRAADFHSGPWCRGIPTLATGPAMGVFGALAECMTVLVSSAAPEWHGALYPFVCFNLQNGIDEKYRKNSEGKEPMDFSPKFVKDTFFLKLCTLFRKHLYVTKEKRKNKCCSPKHAKFPGNKALAHC